ncbi:hypothetical protein Leryth_008514 [Lithospermum erythrorhizon]|nr:hypothetical protein Leryth_008514 [Lithospermum erythrorhizon]
MTEVLHSSPSSSTPSSKSTPTHITLFHDNVVCVVSQDGNQNIQQNVINNNNSGSSSSNQLSLIALLVTLFRKSFWMACKTGREEMCTTSRGGSGGMEIGWPTDVQHVAHVTFDRFNGFLGLPVEFEPEVPRRAPSASTTVFGVSTESMQLSFDHRGNSIPTILLLMQRRLYDDGGLQAEGIFRINGGDSQNEYVRDQLNRGVVPDGIDVHCLAGLIKTWFRELPRGILDPLSPERVMQCQSEEDCVALVRLLPSTESALLDWAINLMADVVQEEHLNKMNTRNIAMVFAPNMTQMADPLTALMYAVQVMNFLKTLIERNLRERQDTAIEPPRISELKPPEDGHQKPSQPFLENAAESSEDTEHVFVVEEPDSDTAVEEHDTDGVSDSYHSDNMSDEEAISYSTSTEEYDGSESCENPNQEYNISTMGDGSMGCPKSLMDKNTQLSNIEQPSDANQAKTVGQQLVAQSMETEGKSKGISNLTRINSTTERVETWR